MPPKQEEPAGVNAGPYLAHAKCSQHRAKGAGQAIVIGSTGNGRNPMFNGTRQPSCGGTSRMTRECQVRICERLGVNSPGLLGKSGGRSMSAIGPLMLDEQTSVSAASRSGLGPGCVETFTSPECEELFSLLSSPNGNCQRCWFSNPQKSRRNFYAQIERRSFHTAWTHSRLPMREQTSSGSAAEKISQFILQLACRLRDSTGQGQTGRDLIFRLRNHLQKAPWKGDGIRAYY